MNGDQLRDLVRDIPDFPIPGVGFKDITPVLADPLALGTVVHDVLQRLRFGQPNPVESWCRELSFRHAPLHLEETATAACELVQRFIRSPLAARIQQAAAVHREVDFLLAWPHADNACAEQHVRGFIDCLFCDDNGRWMLLDYKTNQITAAEAPDAARQYELQLGVYAMAAESAFGRAPSQLLVYFLHPEVEHCFAWNEALRNRVIEQVNDALRPCKLDP